MVNAPGRDGLKSAAIVGRDTPATGRKSVPQQCAVRIVEFGHNDADGFRVTIPLPRDSRVAQFQAGPAWRFALDRLPE